MTRLMVFYTCWYVDENHLNRVFPNGFYANGSLLKKYLEMKKFPSLELSLAPKECQASTPEHQFDL